MKAGWTFFRLELKRYGKMIPGMLLGSLLFAALILCFGLFAVRYVYGNQVIGNIKVGVVSLEDEKVSKMLVKFVSSMDSMEEICSFELMEEDTARKGLTDGSIYAAVILPEGMMDSIMDGRNIPARVLFSTAYSRMETEVFKELAGAGSRLLTTAQAGIYAADELCSESKRSEWIQVTEDYLNGAYLEYVLNRTAIFKLEEVNAVRGHSLIQYYSAALLLAFVSFVGLIMGRASENAGTALRGIMSARGCYRGWQFTMDVLAYAVVFMLFSTTVGISFFKMMGKSAGFSVEIPEIFMLSVLFFSMGIFIRALIGITGNKTAGLGIAFVILLVMMAAAGLFLPQAFLPRAFSSAGEYFPYKVWLEAVLAIMD